MRYLIICLLSLLSPYLALADETHIEQARQTLKNYGLSHCILAPFNEQSALRKDIALSANAYSFMGNGLHSILQNEDMLQVLHDRYKATRHRRSANTRKAISFFMGAWRSQLRGFRQFYQDPGSARRRLTAEPSTSKIAAFGSYYR
jgi:hypothetical protein